MSQNVFVRVINAPAANEATSTMLTLSMRTAQTIVKTGPGRLYSILLSEPLGPIHIYDSATINPSQNEQITLINSLMQYTGDNLLNIPGGIPFQNGLLINGYGITVTYS